MKIEVGKKYWTRDRSQWAKIYGDTRDMPNHDDNPRVFIACYDNGNVRRLCEDGTFECDATTSPYDLVEEYHEPIKRSVDGWLSYESDSDVCNNYLSSRLINYLASPILYGSKEHALSDNSRSIYGRFTFEELPEPE